MWRTVASPERGFLEVFLENGDTLARVLEAAPVVHSPSLVAVEQGFSLLTTSTQRDATAFLTALLRS